VVSELRPVRESLSAESGDYGAARIPWQRHNYFFPIRPTSNVHDNAQPVDQMRRQYRSTGMTDARSTAIYLTASKCCGSSCHQCNDRDGNDAPPPGKLLWSSPMRPDRFGGACRAARYLARLNVSTVEPLPVVGAGLVKTSSSAVSLLIGRFWSWPLQFANVLASICCIIVRVASSTV
jgi:hypothetical protein